MRRIVTLAAIVTAMCISTAAFAQNVVVNGNFEASPPPVNGNNIGWSISPWVLGTGNSSNVVKVDGPGGFDYGSNGPESDALAPGAGVSQHYLDITNGSNDFYQSFIPECSGQLEFGGSFSTRINSAATASVTLRQGVGTSGTIVGTTNIVNLPGGTSKTDPWTLASFTVPIIAWQTYSFIVQMDNNMNFDNGFATYQVDCRSVGVNKDLKNTTGQIANDIEILLQGSYSNVNHYDGYFANLFGTFTESPAAGGNTRLRWSNPNNDVGAGQIAHVGFNVPGSAVTILGVFWTRDGGTTGCAHQCSTSPYGWNSPGSQVIYKNDCLSCESVPRWVGDLRVEWHASEVPLADLNATASRTPIRTDICPAPPILLAPGATAAVNILQAPPNARFGVVIHKVSSSSTLSGPDVTTDFLQYTVPQARSAIPTLSEWGVIGLILLMAASALWMLRRRSTAPRTI